jgi:hypothetical protein
MGHVALGAVRHLKRTLSAVRFAEVEPREYFDPPGVAIRDGLVGRPIFPKSTFYVWKNPRGERDLVLLVGESQPVRNAYTLAYRIAAYAKLLGVDRITTFAAAPTAILHSSAPGVWATASDPALLSELSTIERVTFMKEGQITGMNGLLLGVARECGLQAACLLGELPYYTMGIENPRSSKVVLEVFSGLYGLPLDLEPLEASGRLVEEQVDRLVQSSIVDADKKGDEEDEDDEEEDEEEDEEGIASALEPERDPKKDVRVRHRIEEFFRAAERDREKALELKRELDRHGLFGEYEDRFLDLFKPSEDAEGEGGRRGS